MPAATLVSIDRSKLVRRLRTLDNGTPAATRVAINVMGRSIAQHLVRESPKDTHRYVDAWARACNQAGFGPVATYPLTRSRYHTQTLDRLQLQYDRAEKEHTRLYKLLELWFYRKGRKLGPGGRKLERALDKARVRMEEAKQQLAIAQEARVLGIMYGRKSRISEKTGKRIGGSVDRAFGAGFGGTGTVERAGNGWFVRLHNKEPHASIVESRRHIWRDALNAAKLSGVRRLARNATAETMAKQFKS